MKPNWKPLIARLGEKPLCPLHVYIVRKHDSLRRAGLPLRRIEVQPEDLSIN